MLAGGSVAAGSQHFSLDHHAPDCGDTSGDNAPSCWNATWSDATVPAVWRRKVRRGARRVVEALLDSTASGCLAPHVAAGLRPSHTWEEGCDGTGPDGIGSKLERQRGAAGFLLANYVEIAVANFHAEPTQRATPAPPGPTTTGLSEARLAGFLRSCFAATNADVGVAKGTGAS